MDYHREEKYVLCHYSLIWQDFLSVSSILLYGHLEFVDAVEHEVCGQRAISKVEAMDLI